MISLQAVSFTYPHGQRALHEVSLEIAKGQLFGLLGPNGAGKTTLLRIIVGDLRPEAGTVVVLGADPARAGAELRRRVGIVPQGAGLFVGLRVAQHLRLFGPLKGLDARQTRAAVDRVVADCELGELVDRTVGTLSGGQQRRILVAMALLAQPELLILDEPTTGLDPLARRNVWSTIERQLRAGTTVILTSHYLEEVEFLSNRIGLLRSGELMKEGTLAELCAQLPYRYVLNWVDRNDERREQGFPTLAEARAYAERAAVESYSLGPVRLENLYIQLFGGERAASETSS